MRRQAILRQFWVSPATTYTFVGDGAVGLLAIKMAEDLMANEALDYCLVVGTEEVDWLLCDAYRRWRLLRSAPPIEPFGKQKRGMILSEGAGAIVLARDGPITIERAHPGGMLQKASGSRGNSEANAARSQSKPKSTL